MPYERPWLPWDLMINDLAETRRKGIAGEKIFWFEGGKDMCEAHAFIVENGEEKKIMENVDLVEFEGDQAKLVNIFGEQKVITGRLKVYDNAKSKIVFEPL